MSLFGALLVPERKVADASALTFTELLGAGASTKSGIVVSRIRAMRVAAAFACARALAEGIAQVPLKVYKESDEEGKVPARKHPLYRVLHRRPNDWQTAFEFRETAMYHAIFARGFFALKNGLDAYGRPYELLPLVPGSVTVKQSRAWDVTYEVRDGDKVIGTFPREMIFHLRGPSWNTIEGVDFLDIGREALGLSIALEETQALLHKNGARPGGLLTYPNSLEEQQKKDIAAAWFNAFGTGNQFGTAVLDLGAKYERLAMTGVDAQHLETRKHQVEEVCRIMRVHPQMVFHTTGAMAYAASEQNALDHVKHSLGPWYARWEQAIDRDLLTEADVEKGYSAEFTVEGLLRGDVKTRYEAYGSAIEKGWMTRNEARRKENLSPLPGLDKPLRPLNMDDGSAKPSAPVAGGGRGNPSGGAEPADVTPDEEEP